MRAAVCLLLALAASDAWAAQRIVMYRCTDAQGAVMLQNDVPCPKGSKQEKRVVDAPPPPPAALPPPALPTLTAAESAIPATPPAPAPSATPSTSASSAPASISSPSTPTTADPELPANTDAPSIAPAERLPPPALYRCETYNKQRYFSETGNREPRCVPLQAVGLDGNPETGAGQACEMVSDTCKRVADESLCKAWQLRLRDAESAAGFGKSELTETSKAELERIGKIMRGSACGE